MLRVHLANGNGNRRIATISVQDHARIDAQDIAYLEFLITRYTVDSGIVDGGIDATWESLLGMKHRHCAKLSNIAHSVVV